ncbi:molecular chaperone DnaJ [Schaalia meyeri]|uniref:DnaJ domain-containing protein n=1 Tax=Schaalia meyeri TaxID=52773 RepID=A0AAP9Y643_9ACTO|nr:DnaJ C-terminal domain-containing protein [Schaalia meyeri]AKU65825.1 molecular chaperone DnaJ [Schaalia meyeri]OFQ22475.1 molecular chaperone DnaJ [Actinomyces sp. HMSC062G12]QQC43442.1 DnaJ domain-containing protein [Schaalia meyeri]SDR91960.1 molecular chaperone DnaJ [Schaalia meyeri]
MSEQEWLSKDFYKVLGVDKKADKKTVTKAYRKLARRWHPDQNPGDKAAEAKFKDIGEAYAVLSNDADRKRYDAIRAMTGGGARFSAGSGAAGGFEDLFGAFGGGGGGGPRVRFQTSGGPGAPGFEDILSGLFGGGAGARAGTRDAFGASSRATPTPEKGGTLRAKLSITFRQALTGATLTIKVGGSPIKVRIPAGIRDGQKVRVKGHGRPGTYGGPAGDLEVTVTVKPHPVYSREGNDLVLTLPVTVSEAILGAVVDVPTIDGTTAAVKVPAGSSSGTQIRVRGAGVRGSQAVGDLIARVSIQLPDKPGRELKKLAKAFAQAEGNRDVRASLVRDAEE